MEPVEIVSRLIIGILVARMLPRRVTKFIYFRQRGSVPGKTHNLSTAGSVFADKANATGTSRRPSSPASAISSRNITQSTSLCMLC